MPIGTPDNMAAMSAPILADPARATPAVPDCIFVDLENILGTRRDAETVAATWATLARAVDLRERDHVVVASGPVLARVAVFVLPLGRISYKIRAGIDGADSALIDQFDPDWLQRNYGRFVICSGDHAFAGVAREAAARGIEVVQILGRGLPSAELSRSCHRHQRLDLAA